MAESDVDMESDTSEVNKPDLAYDPEQDPEVKRKIRRNYRELARETEGHNNPNDYTAEELAEKLQRANTLFGQVKGTQEATLDSAFLVMASHMSAMKARSMKSSAGAFDVEDFVSKLITFMGGRKQAEQDDNDDAEVAMDGDAPLDWDKVGRKALAKSRRVPAMDFMLGPLSVEQKKRAQVKRAKLEKNKEDQRKPQELQEEDIARSENETTKNVAALLTILEGLQTINLFKFIINPNDFAQSVENLFYLSFLVRDGRCALETNEDGEPIIFACDQPDATDYGNGLQRRQLVMEFDMATWRRAIEVFEITQCAIPQRPKDTGQTKIKSSTWYG